MISSTTADQSITPVQVRRAAESSQLRHAASCATRCIRSLRAAREASVCGAIDLTKSGTSLFTLGLNVHVCSSARSCRHDHHTQEEGGEHASAGAGRVRH